MVEPRVTTNHPKLMKMMFEFYGNWFCIWLALEERYTLRWLHRMRREYEDCTLHLRQALGVVTRYHFRPTMFELSLGNSVLDLHFCEGIAQEFERLK